jgi:hypothetical protein
VTAVFTYIGVGVVVGALVGLVFALAADNPAEWAVGAAAGVIASLTGWFVVQIRGGRSARP